MSIFHKNRKGQSSTWLVMLLVLTGIVSSLSYYLTSIARGTGRKIIATRSYLRNASGAETALVAYRLAEVSYLGAVSACNSAKPFMEALKTGSGCPGLTFTAFDSANTNDPGVLGGLYRFSGPGCQLTTTASSCGTGRHELLAGELDSLLTGSTGGAVVGYRLSLDSIQPAKGLAEFSAELREGDKVSKVAFAIRSPLGNAAHLESADGRVTQSNPDPLSLCPGEAWADFLVFNPATKKCEPYAQLGGGTGLALYRDRYFGLRPGDGRIVDLNALTQGTSYFADPATGTVNGADLFVPYSPDLLQNTEDISLIDRQIYYLANLGGNPELGYLDMSGSGLRVKVCDLGAMGWSQSYEGIAAHGASDPLFPVANDGMPPDAARLATFYLKTSSGDLLTAIVQSWRVGTSPGGVGTNVNGRTVLCRVFKDQNIQEIEFSRTSGMDRVPGTKPYLLY